MSPTAEALQTIARLSNTHRERIAQLEEQAVTELRTALGPLLDELLEDELDPQQGQARWRSRAARRIAIPRSGMSVAGRQDARRVGLDEDVIGALIRDGLLRAA